LRIWLEHPLGELPGGLELYLPQLKEDGEILLLSLPAGEGAGKVLALLAELGLQVQDIETDQNNLEDVFIHLTGMKGGTDGHHSR
ncbi:MAG: hypothetical protein KAG12_08355, partial [Desulfuromusa sp.]|nr:hypothetical protein [Desulfuromusa sp.]